MTFGLIVACIVTGALAAPERRCGWLHNPTLGNWWLDDLHRQWVLGAQAAEATPAMDDMPDMSTRGWVRTNGYHDYGCACLSLETDRRSQRVKRVLSTTRVPLKQCRADKRLPRP